MKRLIAMLLAFSLLACPVLADAEDETGSNVEEGPCEHFRVWAEWNEEISTETLDGEQHRITAVCPDCGETVCRDEAHAFNFSEAEAYDAEQHRRMRTCPDCGYGSYLYEDHAWEYGEWQTENEGLYFRIATCSVCGMENPVLDFYEAEGEETETPPPEETPEPTPTPEPLETSELTPAPTPMPAPTPTLTPMPTPGETLLPTQIEQSPVPATYPMLVISVTVPDNIPLTVTGDGYVYAIDNLSIENHSDGAVKVSGIIVEAVGAWTLMPYTGSNAVGEAEVKSIGFSVNGACTTGWGRSENLYLPGDWSIAKNAALPLRYNASVSFADIPHEGEQVLSLTFILEWA